MKVWCTRQESSALSLDMKANICCVKYNPGSSNHIAVGSADHQIHYFDLRNVRKPLNVFKGHRKAVSYVKFISPTELASASTDSTLRLWDVQRDSSVCDTGFLHLNPLEQYFCLIYSQPCGCTPNDAKSFCKVNIH